MKIFLDTNVWLRFYLKDERSQFESCQKIISQIEEGKFRAYTSSIVFLEISYVLRSVYSLPFNDVVKILESILEVRGITILNKTDTRQALDYYKKYKIKFTDCLIASQLPKDMILVSFDQDFSKIESINLKNPTNL